MMTHAKHLTLSHTVSLSLNLRDMSLTNGSLVDKELAGWMHSRVVTNSSMSKMRAVRAGVPQGSVWGRCCLTPLPLTGIECTLGTFANNTKLCAAVTLEGRDPEGP